MSYQRQKLVGLAVDLLRQNPQLTVAEASELLGVHRHTLQRALRASGWSFAGMKQTLVLERLERHFSGAEAKSLKQVRTELGFPSASSFARYIRRATGKTPGGLRADPLLGQRKHKRSELLLDPPTAKD